MCLMIVNKNKLHTSLTSSQCVPFPRKPAGQGPHSQDPSGELLQSTPPKHGLDRQPSARDLQGKNGGKRGKWIFNIPGFDLRGVWPKYEAWICGSFFISGNTPVLCPSCRQRTKYTVFCNINYFIKPLTLNGGNVVSSAVILGVVYTHRSDRLFCYSCHCHWPFRYISFHRTEVPGCCTHACDFWLLRHTLLNMSPKETMVPNHHQLKRHTAKVWYWTSWFQTHSSMAAVACEHP